MVAEKRPHKSDDMAHRNGAPLPLAVRRGRIAEGHHSDCVAGRGPRVTAFQQRPRHGGRMLELAAPKARECDLQDGRVLRRRVEMSRALFDLADDHVRFVGAAP